MNTHYISTRKLTVSRISEIISNGDRLELSQEAATAVKRCREYLDSKMDDIRRPVYGVTTGFGSLCNITIPEEDLSQLQHNLVMSHACGTGEKVRPEIVKIMLMLKIQSLSYGYSGVQPETLIGMGEVEYKGKVLPSAEVWETLGWKPLRLQSKEGLALLNGTQFMGAHAVWALIQSRRLSEWADRIGAMSLDAFDGRIEPFWPQTHRVRPHQGQAETAARFMELLEGSDIIKRPKEHVQDPYSFRCIPQVHGASKDTIRYVESVIETEINSATDNPTVFPDEDLIISAGNFHGQPLAIAMDMLAIALAELANISERRIYKLISGQRGLPKFLVAKPGLNSGFMIPQYTAASIVSQNKGLCTPASVDSIPSSQGQEDHVSMGANAATKLVRVVENTERVLAIELFNAAQALDFRRPLKSSWNIEKIHAAYRKSVPFIQDDTYMHPLIEKSIEFIRQ